MPLTVWTIGHSTLPIDGFLALLQEHGIRILADVRTHPGSRRFPHFSREPLAAALADAGIRYEHLPALGGLRKPRKGSPNTAWKNDSFRGYADYMQTPEFHAGLARLLTLAAEAPTAIMCAEALWWRCHRALIADALKARGERVLHIDSGRDAKEHPYTSAARMVDGQLSYEGAEPGLFGGRSDEQQKH